MLLLLRPELELRRAQPYMCTGRFPHPIKGGDRFISMHVCLCRKLWRWWRLASAHFMQYHISCVASALRVLLSSCYGLSLHYVIKSVQIFKRLSVSIISLGYRCSGRLIEKKRHTSSGSSSPRMRSPNGAQIKAIACVVKGEDVAHESNLPKEEPRVNEVGSNVQFGDIRLYALMDR